jgi:hypothetical protein
MISMRPGSTVSILSQARVRPSSRTGSAVPIRMASCDCRPGEEQIGTPRAAALCLRHLAQLVTSLPVVRRRLSRGRRSAPQARRTSMSAGGRTDRSLAGRQNLIETTAKLGTGRRKEEAAHGVLPPIRALKPRTQGPPPYFGQARQRSADRE